MNNNLITQLNNYDLNDVQAQIYLFLLEKNHAQSVVMIARSLGLGRTAVYNAIDALENKGLVKRVMNKVGFDYAATDPNNLQAYWRDKQSKIAALAPSLDNLVATLSSLSSPSEYRSQVKYFSGSRDMEQITFNSLKADGHIYIYELDTSMSVFIEQNVAEEYRRLLVERQIVTHQLTNYKHFDEYTHVEKMVKHFWDVRYIDKRILDIAFEMVIYNDVCALYSYTNNDSFGVEIHNHNLAQMQKQIFKAMQTLARPLKKQGWFGRASI